MLTAEAAKRRDRISIPLLMQSLTRAQNTRAKIERAVRKRTARFHLHRTSSALFDFLQRSILFSNRSRKPQGNVFGQHRNPRAAPVS
jgi:hypothetical protein